MKGFALSLAILFFCSFTWENSVPGGFSVRLEVSPTDLTLTDSLQVNLAYTAPSGYEINRGLIRDWLTHDGSFSLIEEGSSPGRITLTLSPETVGTRWIGLGPITFTSGSSPAVTLATPPFAVHIERGAIAATLPPAGVMPLTLRPTPELDRSNELRLLAAQAQEPSRNQALWRDHLFPWVGLSAIAIALVSCFGLGYALFRYAQQYHAREEAPPSPAQAALLQLDALERRHLPQQGKFDRFYVELTTVLRRYIEKRHGVHAPEQTTQEFIETMAKNPLFEARAQQLLEDLLIHADEVKFAHKSSTAESADRALAYAREFIKKYN